MARRILLFSCADAAYEDFAPLFAFSALRLDPRFDVEVGLEDLEGFNGRHGAACDLIAKAFGPERITWREVDWTGADGRRLVPNTVRFLREPVRRAAAVYISDVDLIYLNPRLLNQHFRLMEARGLPYSNCVRPGTKRLSGMHFSLWDAFYPLTDVSDLDLSAVNDEMVLYEMIRRRGLPLFDQAWERPFPGIHTSPNREVVARNEDGRRIPGWDVGGWAEPYLALAADPKMAALRPLLSERVRWCLEQIEAAIAQGVPAVRRRRPGGRRGPGQAKTPAADA
jgi:hypothetical protein